jgi:hypothetical protein
VSELLGKKKNGGDFELFFVLKTSWASWCFLAQSRSCRAFPDRCLGFTVLKRGIIWFLGWIVPLYVCIMK